MFDNSIEDDPEILDILFDDVYEQHIDNVEKADIEKITFKLSRGTSYTLEVGDILINTMGMIVAIIQNIIYCDTSLNTTEWDYAVCINDVKNGVEKTVPLGQFEYLLNERLITTRR